MESIAKIEHEPRSFTSRPATTGHRQRVQLLAALPCCSSLPTAVHARALQLAQDLDGLLRLQETLHIDLATHPYTGGQQHTGEIGLTVRDDAAKTADLVFSDGVRLNRCIATDVPWDELKQRLARLLKSYMVEGCGKDTFITWTSSLPDQALRERLGYTSSSRA
jgi:sulfite reductase beta subunit-like hemoprotein